MYSKVNLVNVELTSHIFPEDIQRFLESQAQTAPDPFLFYFSVY